MKIEKNDLTRVMRKIRKIYLILCKRNVISIKTKDKYKGSVLISYLTSPFLVKPDSFYYYNHSNQWECRQIANIWSKNGYDVDIIDWDNIHFKPRKKYSFYIDIHNNFERIVPLLNKDCKKILHITGCHWLFLNQAEYSRLTNLKNRRGIVLLPRRQAIPYLGIEKVDYATTLGNMNTVNTYPNFKNPVFCIPLSSSIQFPFFENKDYEMCKKNFLWLGSMGMVHKGLDLVLEAFLRRPEYSLTICGPVDGEQDFKAAFYPELYQTSNIHTKGFVDISSKTFLDILKNNCALIYPSCSEGQAGSVITCLHGGLIPIISEESGVDIKDFGILLNNCSIEEIINALDTISSYSNEKLKTMSKKAWKYARENHTREIFSDYYEKFVHEMIDKTWGPINYREQ